MSLCPIRQYNAELNAHVTREKWKEPTWDWSDALPPEHCLAVAPLNDATCWFASGHTGKHEWEPMPS